MTQISNGGLLNFRRAQLIVEELRRQGVTVFFVSPGSRSTPLTLAVATNKGCQSYVHLDERGAAYAAIGYARATQLPAALICTSGSAVANYLPAITEADASMLPLIALTADRPPELRQTMANQTIEQTGILGSYLRYRFDLPCPQDDMKDEAVLTSVSDAVYHARRLPAGPVQINCMFRKPLEPETLPELDTTIWPDQDGPYAERPVPDMHASAASLAAAAKLLASKQGFITVGELNSDEDRRACVDLAQHLGWPLFPDLTSGLRCGFGEDAVIPYAEILLYGGYVQVDNPAHVHLHIGGRMISSAWYQLVAKAKTHLVLQPFPHRHDPDHLGGLILEGNIAVTCRALQAQMAARPLNALACQLKAKSAEVQAALPDDLSEPGIACTLPQLCGEDAVFASASLPVRLLNAFADARGQVQRIGTNRGTSGIDGVIASAAGYAIGTGRPVTLLIGDLACLHDLNALTLLKRYQIPVRVVVLNNGGGAIFRLLPIARQEKVYHDYFRTPQQVDFGALAKGMGLPFTQPVSTQELQNALKMKAPGVIEMRTHEDDYLQGLKAIQKAIQGN